MIQEIFKVTNVESGISKSELESIIKKQVETNYDGGWRSYHFNYKLKQLFEDDFLLEENGVINANIDELDQKEIESIGKRQEPAYKRAIKDRTIQILKSRDNSPILLKDLWKEVSDLHPKEIAQTNFYKLFYDQELFIKQEINGKQAVSLQIELMPKAVEVNETATANDVIDVPIEVWEAIQKQLKTPFVLDDLLTQVFDKVMSGYRISKSQTEKGIQKLRDLYLDYQSSSNSRWMHGLFQELHEVWNKKTDIYDRRSCLDKLVSSFETFLKKFIWNKDEHIGFGALLNEDSVIKSLRYYYKNFRYQSIGEVDNLKKDMSFALKKLKSMADALRHNMDEEKIQINYAEGNAIKNIQDFIALYVYTASIL